MVGKMVSIIPTKWVFITAVALFEIGSLIWGVAPSIDLVIFGRAIGGIGTAGIHGSCLSLVAEICPLEKRPTLLALFGVVYALSSVRIASEKWLHTLWLIVGVGD